MTDQTRTGLLRAIGFGLLVALPGYVRHQSAQKVTATPLTSSRSVLHDAIGLAGDDPIDVLKRAREQSANQRTAAANGYEWTAEDERWLDQQMKAVDRAQRQLYLKLCRDNHIPDCK